ncbi:MAG: cyclohexanecarboxylate-CoA ligase, partial [Lacrimispora celerecrescens]|nr:cyclohexanecarboxylate-CoA ligase [Lacrimispora celerecrescens]
MLDEIKINPDLKLQYLKNGYWSDRTLADCFHESVRKYPDREYVVDDRGCRYTYRQMDEAASKVAAFLRSQGIGPGDVVSYQIPIWSEFAVITIACFKAGAAAHPIAMSYEEKELVRCLNLTQAKAYFAPTCFHKTDYEEMIQSALPHINSLRAVVLLDQTREIKSSCYSWKNILNDYEPLRTWECARQTGQDIAAILGTSGTTCGSKGVILTHDNIRYSEETFNGELGISMDDIMFMPAPLNHATGFHHGIIAPMLTGAKVVLQQKYCCREAIDLMNQEACTYSMGATPFIYDILRDLETNGGAIPSLKFYLCGGAPVPGYMVQKAWDYGILLCEVYGSTESVPHVFVRPCDALRLNGTTSGKPMEGVEIRVVDENGADVPFGTAGEELSRGPNVFVGYLKNRGITDEVLDDGGWFHSGDLCVMDEDGNIRIIGRKKDMIVRGGENLNSNEINDNLEGCPGILDHTVIGMPDERLGERICAFVVVAKGFENLSLTDVIDYLKEHRISKRFWPERLEIIKRIP